MRTYVTAAALIIALATPSSVVALGAPCAKARMADDACCASAPPLDDADHNKHIERRCCCEIGDAAGSVAHDASAVLESQTHAPPADAASVVTVGALRLHADATNVHPDARGPPAPNSLLAQHVSLLL